MFASLATPRATTVATKAFRRRHDRPAIFVVSQQQDRRLQAAFQEPRRARRGALVCDWHISPATGRPVCGWYIDGDAGRAAEECAATDADDQSRRSLRQVA